MSKEKENIIEIPLTEFDLEEFTKMIRENQTIFWSFPDSNGKDHTIEFMTEDEHKQREQ